MKLINLLLFLVLNSSLLSFAQRFEGGFLAGIVASQVDGDTYSGYNKLGISAGAFVFTPLSRMTDLQLEIKYISKGANKKVTELDPRQYTSNLNYIELPILLKLNTGKKIDWQAGIGFGYLFSFTEKDENGPLIYDESAHFKPFELSGLLGMNYAFTEHLSANIRFSYSILPVIDYGQTTARYFRSGAFNNLFNISIYYNLTPMKNF
jgi:hypothetical protein